MRKFALVAVAIAFCYGHSSLAEGCKDFRVRCFRADPLIKAAMDDATVELLREELLKMQSAIPTHCKPTQNTFVSELDMSSLCAPKLKNKACVYSGSLLCNYKNSEFEMSGYGACQSGATGCGNFAKCFADNSIPADQSHFTEQVALPNDNRRRDSR